MLELHGVPLPEHGVAGAGAGDRCARMLVGRVRAAQSFSVDDAEDAASIHEELEGLRPQAGVDVMDAEAAAEDLALREFEPASPTELLSIDAPEEAQSGELPADSGTPTIEVTDREFSTEEQLELESAPPVESVESDEPVESVGRSSRSNPTSGSLPTMRH